MNKRKIVMSVFPFLIAVAGFVSACSGPTDLVTKVSVSTTGAESGSTSAGNLITTAVKEENNLDIVFYPSIFLQQNVGATVRTGMTDAEITAEVMPLYDFTAGLTSYGKSYPRSQFMVGTLSGADIKSFVLDRCLENGIATFQVAGLKYDITLNGGICTSYVITLEDGSPLEDDTNYKVAFDAYYFNYFPGYRWRNNFEQVFYAWSSGDLDVSASLRSYLKKVQDLAFVKPTRAAVRNMVADTVTGVTPIYAIQGSAHLSPFRAMVVTTSGVVTAIGTDDFGNRVFYLQDKTGDGNVLTSDAIFCFMKKGTWEAHTANFVSGNELKISGLVCEDYASEGLTRTSLRQIDPSKVTVLATGVTLPAYVTVGSTGDRIPPDTNLSTWNGNLNQKPVLNPNDGIDFWETLEGMRVRILAPTVVGFKGGYTDKNDKKSYINVSLLPQGCGLSANRTPENGIIVDVARNIYNPAVVTMVNNIFWPGVYAISGYDISTVFEVGQTFGNNSGHLDGIMTYEMNNFGGGNYSFYCSTNVQTDPNIPALKNLSTKPMATLVGTGEYLTVASFNILNLGGDDTAGQMIDIAEAIAINMKAPDIVCLLEVQDNDGPTLSGSSAADQTLQNLCDAIKAKDATKIYEYVNIDPMLNSEGGEMGGNIRVAYIYQPSRVTFVPKGSAGSRDENYVTSNGALALNPGRIGVNAPAFNHTRRSLAAEFIFRNKRFILIGNHLKSKLGDGSLWGAEQPVKLYSEKARTEQADFVRGFIATILARNSNANILVMGDFNEFYAARPLRVLQGSMLYEMLETLLPFNQRYTYIFQGNSQDIDHIYMSKAMANYSPKVEVVRFNSLYMNHVSDHDPVISQFRIP